MRRGPTEDVLLLVLVMGIVLYATMVLDIGRVLVVFDDGRGVHAGDLVILLLALPVLVLLGKRLAGRSK